MSKSAIWTKENLRILRKMYPTFPSGDIADVIGCSDAYVNIKAKQLGLKKDPEFRTNDFYGRYTKKYRL